MSPLTVSHHHYANGVDVSDRNGDFPWHEWDGHISFAFVKATEGPIPNYPDGLIDTQWGRNWQGARDIGVHRFAYHFFHPDHDPARQARKFVDTVRADGLEISDNFMVDFEVEADTDLGMTVHEQAFAAWVFCREVNRLEPQHHIVVYTFPAFADAGYCAMLGHWGLFIANWNVAKPYIPEPWRSHRETVKAWQFWQYAAGAGGTPDLDRFNGSDHELDIYCTR